MRRETLAALADRLADHGRLVEVGIGRRPALARTLVARGAAVTATDIHPRDVPESVRFVRDDVREPSLPVYADAEAVYALNLPPELHRPLSTLARRVGAACLFTTLGTDEPTVPVDRETLPGETLYRVRSTERERAGGHERPADRHGTGRRDAGPPAG